MDPHAQSEVLTGQIFDESRRILVASAPAAVIYFVVVTAVSIFMDTQPVGLVSLFAISLLYLAIAYFLTKAMIDQAGLAPNGLANGFAVYFGIGILTSIAIGFGVLLLVIPGVIMAVRWAPAYGYGLIDGLPTTEAMSKSWDATKPHFWPIASAMAVPIVANIGVAIGYIFATDDLGNVDQLFSIGANSITSAASVALVVIGLATYSVLSRSDQVADVFD